MLGGMWVLYYVYAAGALVLGALFALYRYRQGLPIVPNFFHQQGAQYTRSVCPRHPRAPHRLKHSLLLVHAVPCSVPTVSDDSDAAALRSGLELGQRSGSSNGRAGGGASDASRDEEAGDWGDQGSWEQWSDGEPSHARGAATLPPPPAASPAASAAATQEGRRSRSPPRGVRALRTSAAAGNGNGNGNGAGRGMTLKRPMVLNAAKPVSPAANGRAALAPAVKLGDDKDLFVVRAPAAGLLHSTRHALPLAKRLC